MILMDGQCAFIGSNVRHHLVLILKVRSNDAHS